jgi:hypothetical protein
VARAHRGRARGGAARAGRPWPVVLPPFGAWPAPGAEPWPLVSLEVAGESPGVRWQLVWRVCFCVFAFLFLHCAVSQTLNTKLCCVAHRHSLSLSLCVRGVRGVCVESWRWGSAGAFVCSCVELPSCGCAAAAAERRVGRRCCSLSVVAVVHAVVASRRRRRARRGGGPRRSSARTQRSSCDVCLSRSWLFSLSPQRSSGVSHAAVAQNLRKVTILKRSTYRCMFLDDA